jgi:hypothetical protein
MQHACNIPRRVLNATPEQVWEQIELEFGQLDKVSDEHLKQRLGTEMNIAEWYGKQTVRVPAVIAERVLTDVIDKYGRNAPVAVLADTKRLLRILRNRLRKERRRPNHRPRGSWFKQRTERIACDKLEQRWRELMYSENLSRDDAIQKAAEEIAPGYYIRPATLLSWRANPKRRRRK